jgi:hypothetical protein
MMAMRLFSMFVMMLLTAVTASAADLGNSNNIVKGNSHVLMHQVWDRDGGEDIASAVAITSLPFFDTGATCDNINDYDIECPYDSNSKDVVYSYIPAVDICISVDLFGSSYDTKTYVYDEDMNIIACDDDHYGGPGYLSFIEEADLVGGMTYYIVVDGYGGDCGEFVLNILEVIPPPPCHLTCEGIPEGEPALIDFYEDNYNGGCNSSPNVFQEIISNTGTYELCGVGGWYLNGGGFNSFYRDTDWYVVTIGETGVIEWTVDAESPVACYLLDVAECEGAFPEQGMTAGQCMEATMTIEGPPLSVVFLFVGSAFYSQEDAGHDSSEFVYSCQFTGLNIGAVAVENVPWDAVKSMYR